MRVVVTGGTGFGGSALVRRLAAAGHEVTSLSRKQAATPESAVTAATWRPCDLTMPGAMEDALADVRPEAIYHLAARTFVPDSHDDASGFLGVNLLGTAHVLAAAQRIVPDCRILHVSTPGACGVSGEPLHEEVPLRPVDPYGASKAAAELWALAVHTSTGQAVLAVRPFGHVGPAQEPRFVAADFACQIGRIRRGEQPPVVEAGNLEAVREFNDVEDIVGGYVAAMDRGRPGRVYNLCSGRGLRVGDLLETMLKRSGVTARVESRPVRLRPADIPTLVGDPTRAREELGWTATTPFATTLDRLLQRWGALDA